MNWLYRLLAGCMSLSEEIEFALFNNPKVPSSFMFGVANSDHQCEAYDPSCEDIWDVWELHQGLQRRRNATDFWLRYKEDISLAKSLGCSSFRLSISWARVEPEPGVFSKNALEHYDRLINTILEAGMQPIVTLMHFCWPLHIEHKGGLLSQDFPDWFEIYAHRVAEQIGDRVRYWVSFNEPNVLKYGFFKFRWEKRYPMPPGLPEGTDQMAAIAQLMSNLFTAHSQARRAIKQVNKDAMIGANPFILGLPPGLQSIVDRNLPQKGMDYDHWRKQAARYTATNRLRDGDVDLVIATLTRTTDRQRMVDFSDTYYIADQTFMVKIGTDVSDIEHKRIAVVSGTTAANSVRSLLPDADITVVGSHDDALLELDYQRVDAVLDDDTVLYGMLRTYPGRFTLLSRSLLESPYAVAVTKGSTELLRLINEVIESFIDEKTWVETIHRNIPEVETSQGSDETFCILPASANKHIPIPHKSGPFCELPAYTIPGDQLEKIKERGYLVVGVKDNIPGFGYHNPDSGKWSGLEIDLARNIAEKIFSDPEKVLFVPLATRERIPKLGGLELPGLIKRAGDLLLDPIRKEWSFALALMNANWWHLGMAGKLPDYLCPVETQGQQDYIGLDYYWGTPWFICAPRIGEATGGKFDDSPVWPGGLYKTLKRFHKLFPGKEILILENGCVEKADGVRREDYIRRHIRQVQKALKKGINVKGYTCWSITTNREWQSLFAPNNDFGLFHIDLEGDPELTRHETAAARIYRKIIENKGV